MTRIRMIGLCLVAAFALSALVAATASASGPNWYECAKVTGGKYEKGCGKEGGKGGYALQVGLGKGKAYKGKGGEAVLHTVIPGKGDIKVACAGAKDVVTPVLGGVAKVKVTFSKCKSNAVALQLGDPRRKRLKPHRSQDLWATSAKALWSSARSSPTKPTRPPA